MTLIVFWIIIGNVEAKVKNTLYDKVGGHLPHAKSFHQMTWKNYLLKPELKLNTLVQNYVFNKQILFCYVKQILFFFVKLGR